MSESPSPYFGVVARPLVLPYRTCPCVLPAEVLDPVPASCGSTSVSPLPGPPLSVGIVLATAVSLLPRDPSSRGKCGPFIPFLEVDVSANPSSSGLAPAETVPPRAGGTAGVQRRLDSVSTSSRVISASGEREPFGSILP